MNVFQWLSWEGYINFINVNMALCIVFTCTWTYKILDIFHNAPSYVLIVFPEIRTCTGTQVFIHSVNMWWLTILPLSFLDTLTIFMPKACKYNSNLWCQGKGLDITSQDPLAQQCLAHIGHFFTWNWILNIILGVHVWPLKYVLSCSSGKLLRCKTVEYRNDWMWWVRQVKLLVYTVCLCPILQNTYTLFIIKGYKGGMYLVHCHYNSSVIQSTTT